MGSTIALIALLLSLFAMVIVKYCLPNIYFEFGFIFSLIFSLVITISLFAFCFYEIEKITREGDITIY
jgi:hypothetical protein